MMLIGQERLKKIIESYNGNFPHFVIIVGNSGKRTLSKFIADRIKADYVECGLAVDAVRDIVDLSYRVQSPSLYVFPNADKMSLNSKNALLKVTEEPSDYAYFILTVKNGENLLDTLFSRATTFILDDYTKADIDEFLLQNKLKAPEKNLDLFYFLCESPSDAKVLTAMNISELISFAETLERTVVESKDGCMFEYLRKLKLKESDTGYDPYYTFKVIKYNYFKKVQSVKDVRYLNAIRVTDSCLRDLTTVFNKLATLDKWIFDIREVLK